MDHEDYPPTLIHEIRPSRVALIDRSAVAVGPVTGTQSSNTEVANKVGSSHLTSGQQSHLGSSCWPTRPGPYRRRVLTDPATGTVLDLGHHRVPTPALARLVRHRQNRCLFPGCGMPAARADIDHTVAHADGGRTALDNLGTLCRHHHRAKHIAAAGWRLEQPTPGVFRWTSPAGRTYTTDSTTTDDEEALLPWEQPWSRAPRAQAPTARPVSAARQRIPDQRTPEPRPTGPCPF